MGFSASAAAALLFAGMFLSFGILYPAMANGVERVSEADAAKADQNLQQAQTDINTTNVSVTTVGSDVDTITINITNTGTTALSVNETNFILGGDYIQRDDYATKVDGQPDTNLWLPGETFNVTYDPSTTVSASSFKIVTEYGVNDRRDI
jgi:flagellar protein FlaF